ncbi:hypothetical protein GOODEAATRI_029929 [Goodea atripinnis]|uniref:Fibronectin type-III domain-containing protein n=1 Tax=Goodea atripinnis TaxID=208336 RepID=A0ABV0Q259_9TELE
MPLDNQSHGDITEYEVTWAKTGDLNQLNKTRVHPSVHRYTLCADTSGEHVVTVTARNKHGSSPPSNITIPVISPKNLVDGLRYSLSIYACTQTSPVLLEKKEGYISETREATFICSVLAEQLGEFVTNVHPYLLKDSSHHTEEHMDIPQLLYKSGEPLNNNTHQKQMALISSQTPQGYQNLHLDTSNPKIPSLSVFSNLTYNLPMLGEDRTPTSELKLQVKNEYQPQSLAEILRQNQMDQDPIPFVSEYIMTPQPPSSQ